jgi:hypothetical protein
MPTHTHDFGNHHNGYSRSKTALVQSVSGSSETASSMVWNLETISALSKITIFKDAILLSGLGSLMICTHELTILNKPKEMIRYCKSFSYGGVTLSNIVANNLTHVSVPIENGKIIPIMGILYHPHHMGISLHPHHGHFPTTCYN